MSSEIQEALYVLNKHQRETSHITLILLYYYQIKTTGRVELKLEVAGAKC